MISRRSRRINLANQKRLELDPDGYQSKQIGSRTRKGTYTGLIVRIEEIKKQIEKDIDNTGECRILVKDGIPLTEEGRALLNKK